MSKKILFAFVLVTLLFFFPVLFLKKTLFYYDTFSVRIPSIIFFKNEVLQGRFPLWNPYLYGGLPHFADPSNSVLSPFNIFYLLLPPILALNIITALAVLLAGVGMYALTRVLGISRIASLFTGFSFLFCGSLITYINDINSLLTITFIPFILFCFINFLKNNKRLWFLLTSFVAVLQFFSGHPQYVYLTWLFLGLFTLIYFPKIKFIEKLKKLSLLAIAFIGLSAIELLPFLELVINAFRPTDLEFANSNQFKIVQIPRIFLVNFYGRLKDGTSWGPGSLLESGLAGIEGYLGFLCLAFFIIALFLEFKKLKNLFFLSFFALAISLGSNLPFYNFLRQALPFFKFFRSPTRMLIFWSFFASLVAGQMFDVFLKRKNQNGKRGFFDFGILFLFFLLIFYWYKNLFIEKGLEFFKFIYEFFKGKPLDSFVYSQEKLRIIFELWHENLSIILLGGAILSFFIFKKSLWWLVIAFVAVEGFWFGRNVFLIAPVEALKSNLQISSFLQEENNYPRITSTGEIIPFTGLHTYWNHLQSRPPFSKANIGHDEEKNFLRFKKEIDLLPANFSQNFKLFNASGYTAIVLKNYASFWDSGVVNSITIPRLDDERLNLAGVKFLITGYPDDFIKDKYENLKEVKSVGEIKIYENRNAYPRAFLLDENGNFLKEAKIISYSPQKVIVESEATIAAKLVLTDSLYPGWQAEVDSEKTEITLFKDVFRQLKLSPGKHKTVFTYLPKSFILGSIISIGTIFILGGVSCRKQKKLL